MAKEIELDVREYHERGEDPFDEIMRYVDLLQVGDSLVLINTFEPFPLYRVMEGKGLTRPNNWDLRTGGLSFTGETQSGRADSEQGTLLGEVERMI